MKFFTLFAVAVLAFNVVSALNIEQLNRNSYTTEKPYTFKDNAVASSLPHVVAEFLERVYELLKQILPAPVAELFHQLFNAIQHYFESFPAEIVTAFANVWNNFPSFNNVFAPEFVAAVDQFFGLLQEYFWGHPAAKFFESFYKTWISATEVFPKEFYATFGRFVEHVPFLNYVLKQWMVFLEQLLPHVRQF
uniref:Uncharacterized protein n=1 Tax=Glossina morsitans morsitans TaxID=37546 RepID=A0A1B0GG78_GLOMM